MRAEKLLFLSTWFSIATAVGAPRFESSDANRPAYPYRRGGHRSGPRNPEELKIRNDDVVYVTEYVDCGTVTSLITATGTGFVVPTVTGQVFHQSSLASGQSGGATPVSELQGGQPQVQSGSEVQDGSNSVVDTPSGNPDPSTQTNPEDPSIAATSINSPPTDSPSNCPNGPGSRHCWNNCTVGTDYSVTWPVTNVVREYWLVVENNTLAPDGFSRQVITFNGTIPGPLITANWGDTLKIHVTNKLQSNGTSVHWHGFRQLNTNDQDGTNGITECPLAPGESTTYEFVATTYGSSWYHSHFSAQYGDGTVGPIVIHGPASANYDEDLGPILIQDWFHQTVFETEYYAQHVGTPTASNYLLNGVNAAVGNATGGNRLTYNFTQGKKYRMRFVNAATDNFFKVVLDGHKFTVIAIDFTPVTPFETDYLPLGVGQRYDVIVEASADLENYWLRALVQTSCGFNKNDGLGIANGVISYNGAPSGLPTSTVATLPIDCHDLPAASLVPVVKQSVDTTTFTDNEILSVGAPSVATTAYASNIFTWSLDGVAIDVDWNNPTLLQVSNGVTDFTPAENVIKLDTPNIWTYWVVQNQFRTAHPMHLHGHDFSLLGQGSGIFDASTAVLNFDNPPRRDTAMLIENGWTVIAFVTDNPGAWLFHCHIGWHVGGGLSLQFLEREAEIMSTVSISKEFLDTCAAFKAYDDSPADIYGKTDSGL